jgi:hypothetical protein
VRLLRRWPTGLYGLLVDGWRVEGAMGAAAGGLVLDRAGQIWACGLDLGLAGPSVRQWAAGVSGISRVEAARLVGAAPLTAWQVAAAEPASSGRLV